MKKRQHINWLLSELPVLCEKGLLPADAAEHIDAYYRENLDALPAPQKIFSLVIGIIGAVMVAGGIILFFNYNWDMFPKYLRIGISALPLALGAVVSYITLCGEKTQLWKECSAILTSVGAAVLTGMLSQIYQLNGELHEFMFFVLLLAIPVLYIFPASHVIKMNVSISITSDTATCQYGTPNGILIIMEIGDVNGIMESHIPKLLSGLFTMAVEHTIATIKGNDTMVLNWLLSVSLSTIPPMAANMAAYNR